MAMRRKLNEKEAGPDEFEVAVKQWEEQTQRVRQLLEERTPHSPNK